MKLLIKPIFEDGITETPPSNFKSWRPQIMNRGELRLLKLINHDYFINSRYEDLTLAFKYNLDKIWNNSLVYINSDIYSGLIFLCGLDSAIKLKEDKNLSEEVKNKIVHMPIFNDLFLSEGLLNGQTGRSIGSSIILIENTLMSKNEY